MPDLTPNSVSLGEAAVRLGEHPFLTFQRLSRGQLLGFKRAGRWQVQSESLERLVAALPPRLSAEQASPAA